ncbi:Conidial yellow pigment biosynthesis polyketide synthase [Daldinia childiae]|uniref:Conidial yellow pigment biosynthesis polyketide synthase n=1 Tax=Daldinia childiae TaxID=326645 RepID=UPI001445B17D|nr:Conidial yellow pigment biosynthesis polyketide synthase [Daldinia childiae]KAF3058488.1 Conidial yellow pigment biosynthesis polyketide synthase [Daldinia childiae]
MALSVTSLGEQTSESIVEKELDDQPGERGSQNVDVESGVVPSSDQLLTKESPDDSTEQREENVVDWDGDDDPDHPYNMAHWRIVISSIVLSIQGFLSPLSSAILAPAVNQVMEEFQVESDLLEAFVVSIYTLALAFGPMIWAPLSEIYGRLWVYHITNLGFIAFTVGCAVAPSMSSLLGFRFLAGIFGSCIITNSGGSIADMLPPEKRGLVLSFFIMGPILGPIIGPVGGGFLATKMGWRWVFWLVAIVAGFVAIMMLLFSKETYGPVILERRAARLRKETGNPHLHAKNRDGLSPWAILQHDIVRPFRLLMRSPISIICALYMAVVYGTLNLLITSISQVYQETYGFAPNISGLAFLGLGIGCMSGVTLVNTTTERYAARQMRKNNGERKPEYKIFLLPIGAVLLPAGLFIYGWTARYQVHWIVPIIGEGIAGMGIMTMFFSTVTYLIDSFTIFAASALAANGFIRSIGGGLLPLAGLTMYSKLGVGWGNSVLGFISLLTFPISLCLLKYGGYLREKFAITNRKHSVLARFIQEATSAVAEEVRFLSADVRALVPPFESVLNLASLSDTHKGPLGGAIEGVLLCVAELASLIGYFENNPSELNLDPTTTCLAGMGVGILATVAISLAPTLADIPITGAEVVRIAFRMGIHVDEVSQNLEPRPLSGSPDPWAYVVSEVSPDDVQKELSAFHAKEKIPESGKIFISASNKTSTTISGPPSRLKALFRNHDFFRDSKFISLPVYAGICHAKHIYGEEDVQAIIQTQSLRLLDSKFAPILSILASSTGQQYLAQTATDLFHEVISELLTRSIHWDNVMRSISERCSHLKASECQLFMFHKSLPTRELISALEGIPSLETFTYDMTAWVPEIHIGQRGPQGPMQSKLAVVGMACRLPGGATTTDEFWEILANGRDVHQVIPPDRFDVKTHYDPEGKKPNFSHTQYGCFIDNPGFFDAPFFNISPKEAEQTDPMQRLALVTAYEALERAGFVPNRTTSSHSPVLEHSTARPPMTIARSTLVSRLALTSFLEDVAHSAPVESIISLTFGGRVIILIPRVPLAWPPFRFATAACTSLWAGDCDTVVAGGLNILTNSDGFAGLCEGYFLTKTPNACKTWDSEADGYCRADAIGSLVLKRLEDAEADNDNILGVIVGAATNHSAEAVSITHPDAAAQSELTRKVLSRAGIDPLDVSYVELHGTGTQAGDLVEIKSVTDVFAPIVRRRSVNQPLHIGAVKANVGHSESGAGVTAMLKVLLMLEKEKIPPHIGIKGTINPGFPKDLDKRNVHIPFEEKPWARVAGKKRIAVVNNFSAAGGNTSIIIEEATPREITETDPRPNHVITVSAKSKTSLRGNIERYLTHLGKNPDLSIADLSYTTTARRHHHSYRVGFTAANIEQVKIQLSSKIPTVDSVKPVSAAGASSIAFAFTGQGASHKSMNIELFHTSPYFRSQITHLDSLARNQGFPSFIPAIDGSFAKDQNHSPVITQLAQVCTQMALTKYWCLLGVKPTVVVGHSLGEYAALHAAGVLTASDAIFLVGQRARLLEQKCQVGSHKMMAVRASRSEIEESARGRPYEVACINGPKEIVLSGPREEIDVLGEVLQGDGHRCVSLDVSFAFHSDQTDPVLDEFEAIAKSAVLFKAPELPVVSPLLAKVIFDEKTVNAQYVRRATREAVDFAGALQAAHNLGTVDDKTAWIEIGPHPVCMSFVKSNIPATNVAVPSLRRDEDSWSTMAQSMCALHCAGVDIDWHEFHRPFERALRLLDLPTYKWNDKNHWIQYNGDWMIKKDKMCSGDDKKAAPVLTGAGLTSSVQHLIEESVDESTGITKVTMQSNLMQKEFLAAANGHSMNGCGVVTSSIHADIAYTLGEYLYRMIKPKSKKVDMNIANLVVTKGLVACKNTKIPQNIQVSIESVPGQPNVADLHWHNVMSDGLIEEAFATANIIYGDAGEWHTSWAPIAHLVQGRMEAIERAAQEGFATRFSNSMAYLSFAKSLVDYAPKYRGMQSVILNGFEGVAEVTLATEMGGTWTVPPHFIDSVAHLAGFIMNVSDAIDNTNNFCVTPGWNSMRFSKPLVPGAKYKSYTKMIPTVEDPSVYLGDVYIMQDGEIMGMVGGIKFRRYPRLLLSRFFSAPDDPSKPPTAAAAQPAAPKTPAPKPVAAAATAKSHDEAAPATPAKPTPEPKTLSSKALETPATIEGAAAVDENSTAGKALEIIAREAALEVSELTEDVAFSNLGVDSLLSLVIAEKFRAELGVPASGGVFLEYPSVGELIAWLTEYYG